MTKKLLFISTNSFWGGSEELWVRSAVNFKEQGFEVFAAALYDNEALNFLSNNFLNYHFIPAYSFPEKLLYKLKIKKLRQKNVLFECIQHLQPQLVIISQGDNIQSLEVMQYCALKNFRYITLTQLVQVGNFFALNNNNIELYRSAYLKAQINFFVSKNNLNVHQLMLGVELPNALTTPNPCKVYGEKQVEYPSTEIYKIAIVGRIETFHKGHDILLQVLDCEKWRKRNVHFNIYGTGPHSSIIISNIERLQLKNISIKGFCNDVKSIWQHNHLLCMPSRLEGQSLALIEAMYFARAAMVTDVGGVEELISDELNGFIAASATVKDIDEALERAWSRKDDWEKMGELSRNIIAEKYRTPAEVIFNKQVSALIS